MLQPDFSSSSLGRTFPCPGAVQVPDHPAPRGKRWGKGQSAAKRCSGIKKGQATKPRKSYEQVTAIVMAAWQSSHIGLQFVPRCRFERAVRLLYHAQKTLGATNEMVDESRVTALKEILNGNPEDAFARYALGLEYSGAGDTEAALAEFQRLLTSHPDYTNGYFMAAQTLARAERKDEARSMLSQGIASAERTRNQHALAEMQTMLDELELGY
jgi:tetratricopeptide (TPR) repeat protein